MLQVEQEAIAYLRSPRAIRERCGQIFELAMQDRLQHFRCHLDRLDATADYVIQVMQENYPDLQIPFHSRWRHFEVGGRSRMDWLNQQMQSLDPIERTRIKFDLAITSVLLDAGAGQQWCYREPDTDLLLRRSEGLAIASFHLFRQGYFSSQPNYLLQADAIGLTRLTETELAAGLQHSSENPLVGLSGRLELLQKLGQVIQLDPDLFGHPPRLGNLVDYLLQQSHSQTLTVNTIFQAVLSGLSAIWPGRLAIAQVNLGDVWPHTALPQTGLGSQWVPFHKLSQWLTYSLLEPLEELGLTLLDLDDLTGLAEYRNGGLCIDMGLLQPKDEKILRDRYLPGAEAIVEWRALTIVLLDQIAQVIRQRLGQSTRQLPLVKVLEGGTWAAGRKMAAQLRAEGGPPIEIVSDGTVY
jgi:hypothetical protein